MSRMCSRTQLASAAMKRGYRAVVVRASASGLLARPWRVREQGRGLLTGVDRPDVDGVDGDLAALAGDSHHRPLPDTSRADDVAGHHHLPQRLAGGPWSCAGPPV